MGFCRCKQPLSIEGIALKPILSIPQLMPVKPENCPTNVQTTKKPLTQPSTFYVLTKPGMFLMTVGATTSKPQTTVPSEPTTTTMSTTRSPTTSTTPKNESTTVTTTSVAPMGESATTEKQY